MARRISASSSAPVPDRARMPSCQASGTSMPVSHVSCHGSSGCGGTLQQNPSSDSAPHSTALHSPAGGLKEVIATPGHTPGHQSLAVKLPKTGLVLLSGDMVHQSVNWTMVGILAHESALRGGEKLFVPDFRGV
mgnify:CR=1 FL=1